MVYMSYSYSIRLYLTIYRISSIVSTFFLFCTLRFVAQVAGKVQGLLDGDIGYLGSASLTERQVTDLMNLAINDTVKLFEKEMMNTATEISRSKRQKLSSQALWRPLDPRQQLQLELVARLLACSQRFYMAREEWDALENPDETLEGYWKIPGPNKDEEWIDPEEPKVKKVPAHVLAKCPWMCLIIRKLITPIQPVELTKISNISSAVASTENTLNLVLKILEKEEDSSRSPMPYLAIIGACADLFPAGECWASSTTENWYRFAPKNKLKEEVIYCHGSSPGDLTMLLSILSKLLVKHGSPEGDPRIQYWILLVLTKITETTAVILQNKKNNSSDLLSLITNWRIVWTALLRPDLRYVSYASFLGENSLGEIVVILLTEMVSKRCTETLRINSNNAIESRQSSFVYEHQNQIWNFLSLKPTIFGTERSRAHFELISSILRFVGLSDSQDIDAKPLRHALFHISLSCIKYAFEKRTPSALEYSCNQELIRAIASCIIGLISGKALSLSRSASTDSRFLLMRESCDYLSVQQTNIAESENVCDIFLKLLWGCDENFRQDRNISLVTFYRSNLDLPCLAAIIIRQRLKENEMKIENRVADFISEAERESLRQYVFTFLGKHISHISKDSIVHNDPIDSTEMKNDSHHLNSYKTGGIKLILSLLITQTSTDMGSLGYINNILRFFVESISKLAHVRVNSDDYLQIASDLQQIAQALVEIRSRHQSTLNLSQMTASIIECKSMLKEYADNLNSGNSILTSIEQSVNDTNFSHNINFDDDDSDSSAIFRSSKTAFEDAEDGFCDRDKRNAPASRVCDRHRKKRRKTQTLIFAPPNHYCAKAIGSILIAIDPSVSNCRLLCESLLGAELDVNPEDIHGDMDLRLGIACLDFLAIQEVLLNSLGETEEFSPVDMICRTIKLIRTCAEPSSRLYMYGNQDCAKVVVQHFKLGIDLKQEEAVFLVSVMSDEEGMRSRPFLRAQRIKAATLAFENGSDTFHRIFDKFFANSIVKGLEDENILVRRFACIAAGIASCKLDEERIIKSVRKVTAPISMGSSAQDIIGTFTDWYLKSGFARSEEQDRSDIEAKDSLEFMESDSIFAQTLLAGSTPKITTFQKILHELLEIPVNRPGLEFMCHRALDRIACMRDYPSVQGMLDAETEGIMVVWLQNIEEKNIDPHKAIFSLSLTSPSSVWAITLYGQYNYLYQNQFAPEANDESTIFRKLSGNNFLRHYQNFIFPFTLLKSHDAINQYQDSMCSIIEYLSRELGLQMVLLFLKKDEDESDESAIIRLLRTHVVDIQAIVLPLIYSDDTMHNKIGQNVLQILVEVLSSETVESKTNKKLSILIRRVIYLLGKSKRFCETIPTLENPYYKAIMHRMDLVNSKQKKSGDNFISVGTSLTEVTIYACNELEKSKLPNQHENAWLRLTLLGHFLVDQLKSGGGEQIQLNFFLHELKEIALKPLFNCIRPEVLSLIGKVLRESIQLKKTILENEVSSITKILLGICFHIHEENQMHLLQRCRRKSMNREFDLLRSCGVHIGVHDESESNTSTYELSKERRLKKESELCSATNLEHECLVCTYDIINWVAEKTNREVLRLNSYVFVSLSNTFEVTSSDLEFLSGLNGKYCAQNLAKDLDKFNSDGLLHQCIIGLSSLTSRPYFTMGKSKTSINDSSSLSDKATSFEERMLCAELSQVENALSEVKVEDVTSSDFNALFNCLRSICSAPCSLKARFASSRCMALLQPTTIIHLSDISSRIQPVLDLDSGGLILDLQARCIDSLAECLKSPKTDISMGAVNTLEALLSNHVGRNASRKVAATNKSLINPFITKDRCGRVNTTLLSDKEKKILLERVGMQCYDSANDENTWCWNKKLWTFKNTDSPHFELWIRNVTTAIIFCCFDSRGGEKLSKVNESNDGDSPFFWHCQRMSYLDHRFASTVFPALILCLLNRKEQSGSSEINNMNILIKKSFEAILRLDISPHEILPSSAVKAISIIIDTLDVLRKYSQDTFLSSKHKLNNKKIKKAGKGGKSSELEPPLPWQGLSFGTILHLDGILVAEACMKVQRFASALFFLDLYFNSQYGKSGGVFEEMNYTESSSDVIGKFNGNGDISGIRIPRMKVLNEEDIKAATIRGISMTGICYKELHEAELMHATNQHLNTLNFMGKSNNLTHELDKLRGVTALDTLQVLSFHSSQTRTDHQLPLHIIDSMEDLGLSGLIKSYIEGILVKNTILRETNDGKNLREKWFENNLEGWNWDMAIGGISNDRDRIPIMSVNLPRDRPDVGSFEFKEGFFESVSEALHSFSNSDINSLSIYSNQARYCIVQSISNIASERLSSSSIIRMVDKLRALKEFENGLVSENIDLSKFNFGNAEMFEISSKMRQISLTSLAFKYPENSEVLDSLKCHLWETCDNAVNRGRPHVAESALSKLRYLSNLQKENPQHGFSGEILRLRLEEAKIMECRGDFNGAIQRVKQLIQFVDKDINNEYDDLLTDAQMLCGSWMRRYKTNQARIIIESYLRPAADRAKCILEAHDLKSNSERATNASLELGHVLANLYDDLLSRINSQEWKETEARLQRQHQQFLDSKEHCRELKTKHDRLKKGTAQKAEIFQEYTEMDIHYKTMERETQRMMKERDGIESSVPIYLNSALKSFLSALTAAGTDAKDLSSDIFRMVSLWFSSQNDSDDDSNANDVMREGFCHIPSYRFVPLTNQLFSRIESCEYRKDQHFQKVLHDLIFRMCYDHPYHCLVPLIALTNGKMVGSAAGGRISTYLENTGDSKIVGATNIIEKLSKSESQFVRDLLESYMALTSSYNDLAHASTKKYQANQRRKKKIKFSDIFKSSSRKSLDRCLSKLMAAPCIITSPPMIRPGKDYGDGKEDPIGAERIASFESEFSITDSGIHRPKIVVCIGSQGGSFRQLVKGEDDIRQDAIMSQVFNYVNNIMKVRNTVYSSSGDQASSKAAKRRTRHNLKMVTYNILPLSPSSGVSQMWLSSFFPKTPLIIHMSTQFFTKNDIVTALFVILRISS